MGLHAEKIERWMVTSRQGTKNDMRYRRWLKKMRNNPNISIVASIGPCS